jgi:hypothetical protein
MKTTKGIQIIKQFATNLNGIFKLTTWVRIDGVKKCYEKPIIPTLDQKVEIEKHGFVEVDEIYYCNTPQSLLIWSEE